MRPITAAVVIAAGVAGTAAFASTASAQEAPYMARRVPAPANALEIKLDTGYTQGFGMVAPGRGLPSVAGPGIAFGLNIDHRATEYVSYGIEASYQEFSNEANTAARGVAGNVGITWHGDPLLRGDPWARLGVGYRLLWEVDPTAAVGTTVLRHGFELASLKIGYDLRLGQDVAIAPVVGADVNLFLWEMPSGGTNHALATAQAATFVYAGLQGRFDLGGQRVVGARETTARR